MKLLIVGVPMSAIALPPSFVFAYMFCLQFDDACGGIGWCCSVVFYSFIYFVFLPTHKRLFAMSCSCFSLGILAILEQS